MRKQSKSIESLSAVAVVSSIALLLSACDVGAGGSVTGGVAPRSASGEAIFKCASEKLSGLPTPVQSTEKIKVCRLEGVSGENTAREAAAKDVEAKDVEITPRFYTFGKKGRFRILQIVATDTEFEAKTDATRKLENERLVNAFLGEKCGPVIERVFKRASLDTKVIYRSLRESDRLSGAAESGTASSVESLFDGRSSARSGSESGGVAASTGVGAISKSAADSARTSSLSSMDINFILKLKFDPNQGLSIRDEVDAVSSGPLMAVGDAVEEQQLAFCQQVLMRVSENLGIGVGRDCASREVAREETPSEIKKSTIGLSKVSSKNPRALKNLRLADDEVSSIVKPLCGDGAKGDGAKADVQKSLPKTDDSKQS